MPREAETAARPTRHAGGVKTRGGGGEQDAKSTTTVVKATQTRLRKRPQGRRENTGPAEVMIMFILTRLPLPSAGPSQTAHATKNMTCPTPG